MQVTRLPFAVAIGFASALAWAQSTPPSPSAGQAPQAAPSASSSSSAGSGGSPSAAQPQGAPSPTAGTAGGGKRVVTPSGGANADKATDPAKGGRTAKAAGAASPDRSARNPDGSSPRQLQTLYAGVMSDEEMAAYRAKVREVKTYDQCKSLLEATHASMEPRAKAQGKTFAATPTEACDKAKARGRVKG